MTTSPNAKGRRASHDEIARVRAFIAKDDELRPSVKRAVLYVSKCQLGPISRDVTVCAFPPVETYMSACDVRDRRNAIRNMHEAAETKWLERRDGGRGNAAHWWTLVPPEIETDLAAGKVPAPGFATDDPRSRKATREKWRRKPKAEAQAQSVPKRSADTLHPADNEYLRAIIDGAMCPQAGHLFQESERASIWAAPVATLRKLLRIYRDVGWQAGTFASSDFLAAKMRELGIR